MHAGYSPGGGVQDDGALRGIRVLEVGHLISGPFCGHLFADHGADVIKVEPQAGDPMREWGTLHRGVGLHWSLLGRGKRSITLDLRQPMAQRAFRDLAATADVVIENFRPGTMERWGLGWADLSAVNPALVMVRISGFGQTGPYRDRAGFGSIGEAMSGFRHLSGDADRPPARVGISIGDSLAGTQGFLGALLALRQRDAPDSPRVGQVVDVALYEAMFMYMESFVADHLVAGADRQRTGSTLPGIAPSNVYPTSDGDWILIAANQDAVFKRLADVAERPDWLQEGSPYTTHRSRGSAQRALDEEVATWTSTMPADALLEALHAVGVPCGRVYTASDIAKDPHYRAREMLIAVPEPNLGGELVPMPGVVPKLSGRSTTVSRGAPLLGEHTEEILRAELSDDRYDELVAGGLAAAQSGERMLW